MAKKKTSRKPPARSSTTDRVAESLRGRIADGDLAPGQRIIELDVSHDLGVSRSPIREALLRLVEEGLVTILPYRGAIVSPLRRERLVELLEFRLVMERFAIERMIERADDFTIANVRERVRAIGGALLAGNLRDAVEADLETHRAIIGSSGNELVKKSYEGLLAQFRRYIRLTSSHYERVGDLADEHEAILEAISKRDVATARALMEAHITHGFAELLDQVTSASD
ncbi:MAG: GntR family transcriptional regulator [Vulcanimicrobiaceae bacterium]